MSSAAAVTMVIIAGFVWGGFTILLARAIRTEKRKRRDARQDV